MIGEAVAPMIGSTYKVSSVETPRISIISSEVIIPDEIPDTGFTDITAHQEMREHLMAEGVIFHPKDRRLQIPRLDQTGIEVVLDGLEVTEPEDRELVSDAIEDIKGFLSGEAIIDGFTKHEFRRAWRGDHEQRPDGQIFIDVYERGNQLRLNNLTVLLWDLYSISSVLNPFSARAQQINTTADYLKKLISDNNQEEYDKMPNQKKISLVKTFIDESVATLRNLDGVLPVEEITVT